MKKTFAIVGPKVEISFDEAAIDAFMARAILKQPELARDYQVRLIGIEEKTTVQIIQYIKLGEKKLVFSSLILFR